ncbi:MAG: hypothetical protein HC883_05295 [Bdellovibrionaceae bacterium]|nr:hypothetical protein [Pseudobdellovibrionaceae bacterium]
MAKQDLAFEHKVIRPLQALALPPQAWLVAVSGGVDSMVLCQVLLRWRKLLKGEVHVAHVHHGPSVNIEQGRYRDLAQQTVREWCAGHDIPFYSNKPGKNF